MAFISLQQMYDAWKRVQDWVSGVGSDKPVVTVDNWPSTQDVQLTGSNVIEFTIANQVEVRDTNEAIFDMPSADLLKQLRDWEIYITDTHESSTNANNSIDMLFSISARSSGLSMPVISSYLTTNIPYGWVTGFHSYVNIRRFQTKLKGTTNRSNSVATNRMNLSLKDMLWCAEYTYYSGNSTIEVTRSDALVERMIEKLYKALTANVLSADSKFVIQYSTAPTSGSISVRFRGWTY